jgi:hypothetical protein
MTATFLAFLLAASAPLPPDLEAAYLGAETAVRAGDYRSAASRYRQILIDLESRPAAETPEAAWNRALLQLAVVESTLGNGPSARTAMDRVLALDPDVRLDPDLFSPAFRREFESARTRVAARPRFTLRVTSRDGDGQGYVQGRALGPLPAQVRLPEGSYRVGVESGGRSRTVTVELFRDETVVVDAGAPPPDLSAPLPGPSATAASPSPSGAWMRPVAWTASGLAVVAAGLATWQGIAAASAYSDAKAMLQPDGSLSPGTDPASYAAAKSTYQSRTTAAWIAGGSALVLGAGATVLFLLAPSAPVEATPAGVAVRF